MRGGRGETRYRGALVQGPIISLFFSSFFFLKGKKTFLCLEQRISLLLFFRSDDVLGEGGWAWDVPTVS